MPYVSQLAFYDSGLTAWVNTAEKPETSQDSQYVTYEYPLVEKLQNIAKENPLITRIIKLPWTRNDDAQYGRNIDATEKLT